MRSIKHKKLNNKNSFYTFGKRLKRSIINNPLISFTVFLALFASIFAFLRQCNNGDTNIATNLDNNSLAINSEYCPLIVFYEAHSDKAPARMINELLPCLVENGYRTFLFEEPTGMTLQENIEVLEQGMLTFSQFLDPEIFDDNTVLSMQNHMKSFNETLFLLRRIQKLKLNYQAVDLDKETRKIATEKYGKYSDKLIEIRNDHIDGRITISCQIFRQGQVLLLGIFHNEVENKQKDAGNPNVSSVYIIDHSIINATNSSPERRNNDLMLRTKNLLYMQKYRYTDVNIINVYDNPKINVTEEVLSGLKKRNLLN